jgi:hypothetical protein
VIPIVKFSPLAILVINDDTTEITPIMEGIPVIFKVVLLVCTFTVRFVYVAIH